MVTFKKVYKDGKVVGGITTNKAGKSGYKLTGSIAKRAKVSSTKNAYSKVKNAAQGQGRTARVGSGSMDYNKLFMGGKSPSAKTKSVNNSARVDAQKILTSNAAYTGKKLTTVSGSKGGTSMADARRLLTSNAAYSGNKTSTKGRDLSAAFNNNLFMTGGQDRSKAQRGKFYKMEIKADKPTVVLQDVPNNKKSFVPADPPTKKNKTITDLTAEDFKKAGNVVVNQAVEVKDFTANSWRYIAGKTSSAKKLAGSLLNIVMPGGSQRVAESRKAREERRNNP
mgnify:CR=1 FL=1|tara:strand:- start:40 stop:882 length:843 start_codon:yes stop_codon:yes gene_type:complete